MRKLYRCPNCHVVHDEDELTKYDWKCTFSICGASIDPNKDEHHSSRGGGSRSCRSGGFYRLGRHGYHSWGGQS